MTLPSPKLSRLEQETIISWNAQEKTANIYSSDPTVIRRLRRRLPAALFIEHGLGIETDVPKEYVQLPRPKRKTSNRTGNSEGLVRAREARLGRVVSQTNPQ